MFKAHVERTEWTVYVTQPRPNLLISATHRGYLVDLLERMDKQGGQRALPESLPEWKHLDTIARIWGVRHYDMKDAEFDPTSPLGDWAIRDHRAVGLAFAYHPQKHEATVGHYSGSKDAERAFSKFWKLQTRPEIREVGQGAVELSATVKFSRSDSDEADFLFHLSAALGHGLCL